MTTMLPVDYLKQFIERAADVPLQLRRRLALIRDLDEKATQLQREIDEQCRKQLAGRSRSENASKRQRVAAAEPDAPQYDVDSALKRLISLADEKVNIANQIYDFIDKHINYLDTDLQQLDSEIEADRKELGLQGDETACEKLGIELPKGLKAAVLGGGGHAAALEKKRKGRKKDAETIVAQPVAVPTEAEPAYCICNKPSAGNMVGCDNPDCTIEWFHFECVGLTEEPQGEWFCPLCTGKIRGPMQPAPSPAAAAQPPRGRK